MTERFEDVVAREVPRVLGALVRRYGHLHECEDAVRDAVLAAMDQWPNQGAPVDTRAWLTTVAHRRLIDQTRSATSRRNREQRQATERAGVVDPFDVERPGRDETLTCLLLCADPALTPASGVALTLRVVSELTTAQIAAAFLVPQPTMAQRISRAKATLRQAGTTFSTQVLATPERLTAVRQVLYLVFNEGYTASSGSALTDPVLAAEAIRLTRQLHRAGPRDGENAGLLALMLLTHARTPARTDHHGDLVPLSEQDRSLWDRRLIAEGVALIERALVAGPVGPYQLQGAIAAVHGESARWEETDWEQILVLYRMLQALAPSPTVRLNLAVAAAMAHGPEHGLTITRDLLEDPTMARTHRVHAVHAHLLAMDGQHHDAARSFSRAAALTTSTPEQRHLLAMAAQQRASR